MRRRSRSVPRDAPEREQIVGLSHAHKTLSESGRCKLHLLLLGRADGKVARTNNTANGDSAELRSQQTFLIHLMPQHRSRQST
jgi:hypothetical protein